MATKGTLFQGHKISISEDGSTYKEIGCLTNFGLDQPERAKIDTTCSQDTTKTYRFGLRDTGTVTFDTFYESDSEAQGVLEASYKSDENYHFKIAYSDGTEKEFEGNVIALSEAGEVDGMITESVTVGLAGEITTTLPTP